MLQKGVIQWEVIGKKVAEAEKRSSPRRQRDDLGGSIIPKLYPYLSTPFKLAEVLDDAGSILLVVTSTHGAGDVPDNLQPFAKDLAEQHPDLNSLKYGVIALGDSSYDTFCQGGKTLDQLLAECGASRIGERLDIDVTQHEIPEDAAEVWISDWMAMIA